MQMQMKIQIEMEMEIQVMRKREWEMEMHDTSRLGVVQRAAPSIHFASHRIESDWIVSNSLALSERERERDDDDITSSSIDNGIDC